MKRLVRFVLVAVLLGAVGLLLLPSQAQQQPTQAATVPPGIIVKPPGESELQVGIKVGQAVYGVGQKVEAGEYIRFALNKQAVVYLLLIKSDGEVRLLFPNKFVQANFLLPDAYTFPGPGLLDRPFEIPGPEGIAYVQAIATPVPIGLEPPTFTEDFPLLGGAPELVKAEIEWRIQRLQLRSADWAAAWAQYEVMKTLPFAQPPTGNLVVKVIDQQTRRALGEAKVSVAGIPGFRYTDETGAAEVPYLAPGRHQVSVSRSGYKTTEKTVTIVDRQTTTEVFELEPLERRAALVVRDAQCDKEKTEAIVGEVLCLDASKSQGPILLYEWSFEGRCWDTICVIERRTREPFVRYAYSEAGPYKSTVIVVFEDGRTELASVRIRIIPRDVIGPPPGTLETIRKPLNPPNPLPILRPGSIALALISGGLKFILANTSYLQQIQYAEVAMVAGKSATLEFDYFIEALPDKIGSGSGVEIQSFIQVRFFDKEGKELTSKQFFTINTRSPEGLCPASGKGGSERPPVQTWLFCQQALLVPSDMAFVVMELVVDVSGNTSGKDISIQYRNIELKTK